MLGYRYGNNQSPIRYGVGNDLGEVESLSISDFILSFNKGNLVIIFETNNLLNNITIEVDADGVVYETLVLEALNYNPPRQYAVEVTALPGINSATIIQATDIYGDVIYDVSAENSIEV